MAKAPEPIKGEFLSSVSIVVRPTTADNTLDNPPSSVSQTGLDSSTTTFAIDSPSRQDGTLTQTAIKEDQSTKTTPAVKCPIKNEVDCNTEDTSAAVSVLDTEKTDNTDQEEIAGVPSRTKRLQSIISSARGMFVSAYNTLKAEILIPTEDILTSSEQRQDGAIPDTEDKTDHHQEESRITQDNSTSSEQGQDGAITETENKTDHHQKESRITEDNSKSSEQGQDGTITDTENKTDHHQKESRITQDNSKISERGKDGAITDTEDKTDLHQNESRITQDNSKSSERGRAITETENKTDHHKKESFNPKAKKVQRIQAAKYTSPLYKQEMIRKSKKLVGSGNPTIYQLPLREIQDHATYITYEFGEKNYKPMKTILVVGESGAGKSTFINALVNYILNISWEDKFRFRLIQEPLVGGSQASSQTSKITAYKINHQESLLTPYGITIIDTPGFGDTSGLKRDMTIAKELSEFFRSENGDVKSLDAVAFVAKSTENRLTPIQQYIFNSILGLFGQDMAENIFMILTFVEGQTPPILCALAEGKVPYKEFFKFNNSALYADNKAESKPDDGNGDFNFSQQFWKIGMSSYKKFLSVLMNTETRSLTMTKAVLDERERLSTQLVQITSEIESGLYKLQQLSKEMDVLLGHQADIQKNKNFTYEVEEERIVLINIEEGSVYVTHCTKCEYTCHYPCRRPDKAKMYCRTMTRVKWHDFTTEPTCTVCPGKCSWKVHSNVPYRMDKEVVTVEKTYDDLKKRYEEASGDKLNHEELLEELTLDLQATELNTAVLANDARKSIERLNEIALRPNTLTNVDYIDVMIEQEKQMRKPNTEQRLELLLTVRKHAVTMTEIALTNKLDPYTKYKQLMIEDKKNGKHSKSFREAFKKFQNFTANT